MATCLNDLTECMHGLVMEGHITVAQYETYRNLLLAAEKLTELAVMINIDKDGDFFICAEAAPLIHEAAHIHVALRTEV